MIVHPRQIRSFVRRPGRLTRAQERALHELWPRYGVPAAGEDSPELLDLTALFGNTAPCVLEIGFGNGEALVHTAAATPEQNFLGAEVHEPGVGHCLLEIERLGLCNIRLVMQDAVELLRDRLTAASLAGIRLYFPDPWHKKRHHKRRLVQADFVALMASRIKPQGYFHVATDWPDYAEHIQAVLAGQTIFAETQQPAGDQPRLRTRFEARGQRLGHPTWEAFYVRQS